MDVKDGDITLKIASILKEKQTAIFCGAGISFNSGLPVANSLLNAIFKTLDVSDSENSLIANSHLPFEAIMETILNESSLEEIQDIFLKGLPNNNHFLIARLAKAGNVNVICTTNFDLLIERALEKEGLVKDTDFKVYSNDADFKNIGWNETQIKVIKIHGSAANQEELAIIMHYVAGSNFTQSRAQIIRNLFSRQFFENVLILGYSCSDFFDITPCIEKLNTDLNNVFFIQHDKRTAVEPLSQQPNNNPFKHFMRGCRIITDTDGFVKTIWKEMFEEEYQFIFYKQVNWNENIREWYARAINESGSGVKHHIISRLLYGIGAFELTKKHHEKSIAIAQKENNLKAYASEMGNLAMAHNATGEYKQALFCLKESIVLCERIGHLQGLSSQYQAYGNVLHHTGKNEEAIEYHKKALEYAAMGNDEESLCCILGNISNAYIALGRTDEAVESLSEGLTLSKKLGMKQTESSQLGILAQALVYKGKYIEALEKATESLKIKRMMGDKRGECDVMIILINIYNITGQSQEASKVCDECLRLAESIKYARAEQILYMLTAKST